jgi:hypothetical protein
MTLQSKTRGHDALSAGSSTALRRIRRWLFAAGELLFPGSVREKVCFASRREFGMSDCFTA